MKRLFITLVLLMTIASPVFAEEGRDASAKIKQILGELGYNYDLTKLGNFKMEFDLKDEEGNPLNRSHLVFISKTTDKWGAFEVIRVWATVMKTSGEIDKTKANQLLLENYREKFGKWELVKRDDGYRVLYTVKISVRDPAAAYQKAILNVFGRADAMEKLWTGKDDF